MKGTNSHNRYASYMDKSTFKIFAFCSYSLKEMRHGFLAHPPSDT